MKHSSRIFIALLAAATAWSSLGVSAVLAAVTNGTVVRTETGTMYYIDNGTKRWINSPDTLVSQGLTAAPVNVSSTELASVPEGERLTAASNIILPGELDRAGDLAPYPMEDIRLATVNGRTVLRFSSTALNLGRGAFELNGGTIEPSGFQKAFQRIVRPGGERQREVGTFLWHDPHHHYHYDDFADYVFSLVRPATTATVPPIIIQKTTFCLYDYLAGNLSIPNASPTRTYTNCNRYRQGITVGWADKYPYTLPDQFVDVHDLPPGVYRLDFVVDPYQHFLEVKKDNNVSSVLVDLNVAENSAKVVAAIAPFPTRENVLPDGFLLRAEGDNKVYVMRAGKKRWLRNEAVFRSYGYAFQNVYAFHPSLVHSIPNDITVRLAGTTRIFAVSDQGFKRYVLTPEALASYGVNPANVTEVNGTEFDDYPYTDLARRSADQSVFRLSTKKYVGELASLSEAERVTVHALSDADFSSYLTKTIATGLNVPWDIAFLPDGDMLVTERPGQMRRIGKQNATITIPSVQHVGEGGLMGVALHPDFASNKLIYLYFTTTENLNRIERFRFEDNKLVHDRVILEGIASSLYHDGGQLAFGPDGMLYATTGDAENTALSQQLGSLNGKTIRLTPDGAVPADNPFGTPVWSWGHRNAQGMAWDANGRLWETEHGRSGALSGYDELNLIEKSKNYGWPTIQGDQTRVGMVTSVLNSGANDTWAPSGLAFLDGKLYFAGLKGAALYEATVNADGTASALKTRLKNQFGRLRATVAGPDGFLYLTTSNRDGRGVPKTGDDKVIVVYPDFFRAYE